MATSEKNVRKTVTKKAFLKWNSHEDLKYAALIYNKLGQRQEREIFDSLLKYADGISYAHKGNIDKHVKSGGLHDWVEQKFQGNVTEQPKNVPIVEKNQQTLQDTIQAP